MTRRLKQASRRLVFFPLCAILVGLYARDGHAQFGGSVFPPPAPTGSPARFPEPS